MRFLGLDGTLFKSALRSVLLAVAGALLLSGCSANPQTSISYLLAPPEFTPPESTGTAEVSKRQPVILLVGNVRVASYLSGTSLTQLQENQHVVRTRHHAWAEPLNEQLERQLRHGLTQLLPGSDWLPLATSGGLQLYDGRLDLQVDSFHLKANGQVEVAGTWQLRDATQSFMAHGQFKQQHVLEADGYDAMVQALEKAWLAAVQELAGQLRGALSQGVLKSS